MIPALSIQNEADRTEKMDDNINAFKELEPNSAGIRG